MPSSQTTGYKFGIGQYRKLCHVDISSSQREHQRQISNRDVGHDSAGYAATTLQIGQLPRIGTREICSRPSGRTSGQPAAREHSYNNP